MEIEKDKVVAIQYNLKNDGGEVLDQSKPEQPLVYLHGHRNIIPGLEDALSGKSQGDSVSVRVEPKDGYGERRPQLEQVVPRAQFQGVENLEVGMQFQANTEQGPIPVRITKIDEADITVDANHPLAGEALNFEVEVGEVRDATPEEIDHGHAHGPGGAH